LPADVCILSFLSQDNTQKTFSVAVHNQRELSELYWRPDCEVIDMVRMSPNVVETYLRPRSGMNKPSRKTSPVIGSYVTSFARIEMHAAIQVREHTFMFSSTVNHQSFFSMNLQRLQQEHGDGFRLLYSDTDSLIYELPSDETPSLPRGSALHQWKSELPPDCEMVSFHSLGPKFYQYTYEDLGTGKMTTITKLKGFHIKSAAAKEVVHDRLFEQLVRDYLSGKTVETIVKQWTLTTNKRRQIRSQLADKVISNSIFSKRCAFICGKVKFPERSLPFGYTKQMYEKYIL
jgi:hypothetical protein